jgi:ribosome-associated toxin RatA of RatAB toxin-antitoxin module
MVRYFLVCISLLCVPFAPSQAQLGQIGKIEVTVKKLIKNERPMFEVNAAGFSRATQQQAWQVLTDYERLHEFVPDLQSSALLSRNGREAIVEQHSEAGFLFLSQRIHMVVRVTEEPYSIIDVTLIKGDMRSYSAHWELTPSTHDGAEGTRILYYGVMEPDFFVPPLIGRSIVQVNVKRMVEAVLTEIDKRNVAK